MANGASSHSFKIDLDVSNVISGLKAVDATAENITKKLNQALIVPQSLPAGVTAKDVGRAAGDTTRGAVTAFQQRTGINDPAVLKEFRNNFAKALRDAYEPLLRELAAKSGTSKGVQGKDYSSGFKSSFNDTDFNSFLKTLNPAVVKGVVAPPKSDSEKSAERASKKAAETIINLQRKLGDDLGDYDKLVAMSANEQEKLLRQLEQRRFIQKSQRTQEDKALASLESRERVRAGDPDQLLARGSAAGKANFFQIEGEASDILRKGDNGDLEAIVTGKKRIADLTARQAAEVSALLASDEESKDLSAQAVIQRKRLKRAIDSRIAEIEGPKSVSDARLFDINRRVSGLLEQQRTAGSLTGPQILKANQGLAAFRAAEQARREAELAAEEARRIVASTVTKPLTPAQLLAANKGISTFAPPQQPASGLVTVSQAALLRANQGVDRLLAPNPEPTLKSVTAAQLLAANKGIAGFGDQPDLKSVTSAQIIRVNKGLSEFGKGTELSSAQIIRINRGLAEAQRLVSVTASQLLKANQGIAAFGSIKNPVSPTQLTAINKNLSNFNSNLTQINGALTPAQIFAINKNLSSLKAKANQPSDPIDPFLVGPVNRPLSPQEEATKSLNAERARREQELLKQQATTPQDIGDAAAATIGRERIARQKELAVLEGRTAADYRAMGNLHAQRLSAQNQLKTAEFRELRTNEEFMRARAERIVEERKYNHEQRKINARVAREQGFGGTSVLARFLGKFGSGNPGGGGSGSAGGGIPPTLTEFFGHGAANIARYAIPGSIAFGALSGIKNTIKEAEELDRVFATIEAQFDSTFGPASKPKFESFKKDILDIAKATGIAGQDVANVAFQLQGAFGRGTGVEIEGFSGTKLVSEQTRAAAEISKVTGLSSKEITDSLTAASIGFEASFRTIGDVTISLQDRFGVLAKEIIPFLGDIAPVAKEAGFSLAEFATIAATTQQKSGKNGAALAEAYGRVIPQITKARGQLLDVGVQNNLGPEFNNSVANGTTRDVFFAVARDFEKMSKNSQDFVINLLGGRREAQSILAAFSDSAGLMKAIEQTKTSSEGTLATRFERISDTVSESLARLEEKFRQLGVAIYEGGLGEALNQTISLLSLLVGLLEDVFSAAGSVNETFGGMPAKILAAYAAFKLLSSALGGAKVQSLIGGAVAVGSAGAGSGNASPVAGSFLNAGQLAQVGAQVGAGDDTASKRKNALKAVGGTIALLAAAQVVSYANDLSNDIEQFKEETNRKTADELKKELEKTQLGARYGVQYNQSPLSSPKAAFKYLTGLVKTGSIPDALDYGDQRKIVEEALKNKSFQDQKLAEAADEFFASPDDLKNTIASLTEDNKAQLAKGIAEALGKRKKSGLEKGPIGKALGVDGRSLTPEEALKDGDVKKVLADLAAGDIDTLQTFLESSATDPGSQAFVISLIQILKGNDNTTNEKILKIFRAFANKTKSEAATAGLEKSQITLENLKSNFDLGVLGTQGLINGYEKALSEAKTARDIVEDKTSDLYKQRDELVNKLEKESTAFYAKSRSGFVDFQNELSQIATGDTDDSKLQNVDDIVTLLDDPKFTDPDARIAQARKAVQLLQGLDETRDIPEKIREAFAEYYFDETVNPDYSILAEQLRVNLGGAADTLIEDIQNALIGIALGKGAVGDVAALLQDLLQDRVVTLLSITGDELAAAGGSSDSGGNLLATLESLGALATKIATAAKGDIPKIAKGKDGKEEDLINARYDYLKALVEGDPVKTAQLALQEADELLASATKDSDRYKAMAAQVRARRQLVAAEFDVGTSQRELASAMAAYKGDTLKVAQMAVDDAIRQRDEVYRLFETGGAGEADKNRAEVALIQAKANARDAQLASQKDDYQFLYDMGQITKSQFIQYLQTLKQIPDLTTEQIRSLDREIKQLQGELNQDLQFNLPTKFKLPTLYETRRIGQTGSSQAAYVDNRNVNIVLNVSDGSSQQQMMQVLTDVIGGGARITGTKRY